MKIKFNPTGTQIYKEKLLIRLDFYPDQNYKTYVIHYIDVFARELTDEEKETDKKGKFTGKAKELQKLVPKKKQLNPFLCHFISIDPNTTRGGLRKYIEDTFDGGTLGKLDDVLSVDNKKDELYSFLKDKFGVKNIKIKAKEINIEKINTRLKNLEVVI